MQRTVAVTLATAALLAAGLAPSATEAAGEIELNIGSLAPNPSPWRSLLDRMESQIESASGGAINVIIRPPGVMGEVEMVRETRSGERLQACGVTTAALAEGGNIPVLSIIELPYLFDSYAQADKVLDNALWEPVSSALERRGFIMGVWSENGFRSYGTKGRPVRSPSDLTGMKVRSQESDVHMKTHAAFGANAIQKPMTEVLTALKSNVIDGLDNSAVYMLAGGLSEPLDYYSLTRHIYQPAAIVYSRRWYQTLSPEHQAIVKDVKSFSVDGRAEIRAEEKETLALFGSLGMEVVELTPEQVAVFRTKARAIHDSYAAGIEGGPEMLKTIRGAL